MSSNLYPGGSVSSLSPHFWPLMEVMPCCDTCNKHGYSQQMRAAAQCNPVPTRLIQTPTHMHTVAMLLPLWPLARCIQALGVQRDQRMVVCWPVRQMDPPMVPAHATQLSTLEQATCFSTQTHTASACLYLFGSFSYCGRNLHLHLQHRSRISTQTSNTWHKNTRKWLVW